MFDFELLSGDDIVAFAAFGIETNAAFLRSNPFHFFAVLCNPDSRFGIQFASLCDGSCDDGLSQQSVRPFQIDLISASAAQSSDIPVLPGIRKGRKKLQTALMRLQQHLRDPGRRGEVAVDLKRRVGIEQIRIDAAVIRRLSLLDERQQIR